MYHETRHQWIAEAAYFRSEARNFKPGRALDDWLAAKRDYAKLQIALYLVLAGEDGGITLSGLHQLANSLGIQNHEKIAHKIELIRTIQNAVEHRPCFRTNIDTYCVSKTDCKWRAECKKLIATWCHNAD